MSPPADLVAMGRELSDCILFTWSQVRHDAHAHLSGSKQAEVDVNLLVLFFWSVTRSVSELTPSDLSGPILDSMHGGLFRALIHAGVPESQAEAFVNERYAVYFQAFKTLEVAEATQRVVACFIGFCDGRRGYSLDMRKILPMFTDFCAFTKALRLEYERIFMKYAG